MARKHMLSNLAAPRADAVQKSTEARSEYTKRGASRSMIQSLDEMAENSMRLLEGETIVALDPRSLDASFIADRISDDDDEDFAQLRDAIRHAGQSSPILVRPHPDVPDRYMIVFGHRRARVARELDIPVRAVVKPLEDIAHVIAQGQENTARADLTFIEKSLFARKLLQAGMTKETIKAALTIDDTLLSRMLSVAETVPGPVLDAVGSGRGVGRDRWEELKKLIPVEDNRVRAIEFVETPSFRNAVAEERFNLLLAELKSAKKPARPVTKSGIRSFAIAGRTVSVTTRGGGKTFTLALKAKDASKFGAFVSEQLEDLYKAFQASQQSNAGD